MNTIKTRTVGRTGLEVTEMGMGGAPLGDLFELVSETRAQNTLQAAWDAGIRYFDTAPFYGYGKSEHRFGHFPATTEQRRICHLYQSRTRIKSHPRPQNL